MHHFDQAVSLTPLREGSYSGQTSKEYGNIAGPFGGATSAVLLNAVLSDLRCTGDPVSITVNFCAAVADGEFSISSRLVRAGKYIQHWLIELAQGPKVCSTATIICARRVEGFAHQTIKPPQTPGFDDCTPLPIKGYSNWLNRYEFRFSEGAPMPPKKTGSKFGSSKTTVWVKDAPDRPLDYLSLAAISDSFILRLLQVRGTMVPMGTVSLTTHFIGSADEIAAQGAAPLLGEADTIRFQSNFHDQTMRLWGGTGNLLATGSQIVWFKE